MVGDLAHQSEGWGLVPVGGGVTHEGLWKSKQMYKRKILPDSFFVSGAHS